MAIVDYSTIDFSVLPDENLLIGSLVNKASELYASYGTCDSRCNHPSGSCNDNNLNCKKCSEEVHFSETCSGANFRSKYNCQKFVYYYTCRYSWKYCSEIMYAFDNVDLSKYEKYSVLSIGCGQSPDLMALEQMNRTAQKIISYKGYDINPYWTNIHSEIHNYCHQKKNIHCRYELNDVFEVLENNVDISTNIIVISYFLSSIPDAERHIKARLLFDLIISKILAHKGNEPVVIIMNDIDHNTKARDYFDVLIAGLKQAKCHMNVQKKHFKNRSKDYGDGSIIHCSSGNKFYNIPDNVKDSYHCAINCTSAQCIIEVN